MAERAEQRVVERDQRPAPGELRIVFDHVLAILHHAGGKAEGLQLRYGLMIVPGGRPGGNVASRVLDQALHLRFVEHADGDPAILAGAREDVLEMHRGIGIAAALRPFAGLGAAQDRGASAGRRSRTSRHRCGPPRPVCRLRLQRRRRAAGHDERHDHVAVRNGAGDHRVAACVAGQVGPAGQRAAGAVDPPFLRQRTGLAEDAARDHDHARIDRLEIVVAEPELGHRAGREVLDHHVGPLDQWAQHLATPRDSSGRALRCVSRS